MMSTSGSSGAMPADEAKPNWSWLQEKIDARLAESSAAAQLDNWLARDLELLEQEFAAYVTPKSLGRDLKRGR